jgi:hypothetical protein
MSSRPATYTDLLLMLGIVTGALTLPGYMDRLSNDMRVGDLNPRYIAALRDMLSQALHEGGIE